MKRRSSSILASVSAAIVLAGCATSKDIVYFQNIDDVPGDGGFPKYEPRIKEDDRLSIIVSGPDKTVTAPYNLTVGELASTGASAINPESSTINYLVNTEGDIDFPVLGKIHVAGMTRQQLADFLTGQIGQDVKDPVVYVSFKNFKITVLGEVRSPGTYTFDSEKISLLQVLGRAGDLNLTAERDGIILIREEDGKPKHYTIDLKDCSLMTSPYYYLQQNDVIYIPPSATRVATATTATGIWSVVLSSITTAVALFTMIFSLTR